MKIHRNTPLSSIVINHININKVLMKIFECYIYVYYKKNNTYNFVTNYKYPINLRRIKNIL